MPAGSQRRAERKRWQAAALAVLLVGIALRVGLNDVTDWSPADERVYLGYAVELQALGPGGYDRIVDHYLADPARHIFPPPLRYGFHLLSSASCGLLGARRASLGTQATLCSCLALLLGFWFARRFGGARGAGTALIVGVLLSSSPLILHLGRRALADLPYVLVAWLALGAFLVASHQRLRPRQPLAQAGVVVLAWASLTLQVAFKEAGFFLLVTLCLWQGLRCLRERALLPAGWLLLAAGGASYYLVFCALVGNFSDFFEIVKVMRPALAANPYVANYQQGPWYRLLVDWAAVSPVLVTLGPLALYALLTDARRNRAQTFGAFFLCAYWLVVVCGGISHNLRYMLLLELPLRLVVGLWLARFVEGRGRAQDPESERWGRLALVGFFLAFNAAVEGRVFWQVFVKGAVLDPVTAAILPALDFF